MKKKEIVSKIKQIISESNFKVRLIESEDKYALTDEESNRVREFAKKMVDENIANLKKIRKKSKSTYQYFQKWMPLKLKTLNRESI